jgi:hypothetical protein
MSCNCFYEQEEDLSTVGSDGSSSSSGSNPKKTFFKRLVKKLKKGKDQET